MMRLVSICPSNTELATYLNLDSKLVGVDDYSDFPDTIHSLPKLGPDLSIDMDKLESLKPDLVLASLSVPGMEKNIEELKKRNIPYVIFNPNSLNDIAENLLTLGKITGTLEKAEQLVEKFHLFIQEYKAKSESLLHKPSLYWEWWPKPIFTPGGTNWLTEVSELAGGYNIFKDTKEANIQTNWAEIVQFQPDHICMVWVGVKQSKMKPELITIRENANNVPAVNAGNIHVLEEHLYCRPSPRLLLGVKKLASLLHPNAFPDFNNLDPLD